MLLKTQRREADWLEPTAMCVLRQSTKGRMWNARVHAYPCRKCCLQGRRAHDTFILDFLTTFPHMSATDTVSPFKEKENNQNSTLSIWQRSTSLLPAFPYNRALNLISIGIEGCGCEDLTGRQWQKCLLLRSPCVSLASFGKVGGWVMASE